MSDFQRTKEYRTCIRTYSGLYFDFANIESNIILIEDIVQGLSHIGRFVGHTETLYTVAQHSVLASYIVPEEEAFAALMHDASEAYTGDLNKPLKELLPEFKVIESKIEAHIFKTFGLPSELSDSVKYADRVMLATEQRDIMNAQDDRWVFTAGVSPMEKRIKVVDSVTARKMFMDRFNELRG
jgi:5'-deoxynucleotidase YfbR-like HD superfamily hydrolase